MKASRGPIRPAYAAKDYCCGLLVSLWSVRHSLAGPLRNHLTTCMDGQRGLRSPPSVRNSRRAERELKRKALWWRLYLPRYRQSPGMWVKRKRKEEEKWSETRLEHRTGIEPASPAWKAGILAVVRPMHNGGNKRTRTADPLLVRQMLSQLSYAPK